ncbi:MAG: FkbM family methyltransferase [Phycisphaerales bacterium]
MATTGSPLLDAISRFREGRLSDAEHIARRLVTASAGDASARILLGLTLAHTGRQRDAERAAAEAEALGSPLSGRIVRQVIAQLAENDRPGAEALSALAIGVLADLADFERARALPMSDRPRDVLEEMLGSGEPFRVRAGCIMASGYSFIVLLGHAQRAARGVLAEFPRDPALLNALGYACWSEGLHQDAVTFATECLRWAPGSPEFYRRLAMYLLTAGRPVEAFLAAGAVHRISPKDFEERCFGIANLAHQLMEGRDVVRLRFDGLELAYHLTALTSMAIESDLFHLEGVPTESEELKFCRTFAPRGGTIVEVGTLVGNHTVYFAKALAPERIIAVDANPRMLLEVRRNLMLNGLAESVELKGHAVAVGAGAGEIEFNTLGRVPVAALDDLIEHRAGFYKIDVDGAELDVLKGMQRILREDKPRIMLEVDQVNAVAFATAIKALGYRIAHTIAHGSYANHFLLPA